MKCSRLLLQIRASFLRNIDALFAAWRRCRCLPQQVLPSPTSRVPKAHHTLTQPGFASCRSWSDSVMPFQRILHSNIYTKAMVGVKAPGALPRPSPSPWRLPQAQNRCLARVCWSRTPTGLLRTLRHCFCSPTWL